MLCRRLFGKKSERVDAGQLQLALEQLANEPGAVTEPLEWIRAARAWAYASPANRAPPLPGHLPPPPHRDRCAGGDKHCACGHLETRIGESVTDKLEYEPASFTVIETVRAKYACPHSHNGILEAAPPRAIENALAGEELFAHIVVSKCVDRLPLYRLEQARENIDISRTACANGSRLSRPRWPYRSSGAKSRAPITCRSTTRSIQHRREPSYPERFAPLYAQVGYQIGRRLYVRPSGGVALQSGSMIPVVGVAIGREFGGRYIATPELVIRAPAHMGSPA